MLSKVRHFLSSIVIAHKCTTLLCHTIGARRQPVVEPKFQLIWFSLEPQGNWSALEQRAMGLVLGVVNLKFTSIGKNWQVLLLNDITNFIIHDCQSGYVNKMLQTGHV